MIDQSLRWFGVHLEMIAHREAEAAAAEGADDGAAAAAPKRKRGTKASDCAMRLS